jgi:hypothetical protein
MWGLPRRGHFAVFGGRRHAPLPVLVEDQHGWAPLEARISPLARPIPVARFAERNVAIRVVFAQRMFLTSGYVLRPVASVCFLVVKKAADTELFRCRSVPAGPVARTRRLVPEDAVQPVAVLRALRRIFFFPASAVGDMRVVTYADETVSPGHLIIQPIGAALKESLAFVTLVVKITVGFVGYSPCSRLASLRSRGVTRSPWRIALKAVGMEGGLPLSEGGSAGLSLHWLAF